MTGGKKGCNAKTFRSQNLFKWNYMSFISTLRQLFGSGSTYSVVSFYLLLFFCNHMWRMQNVESANFLSHISVPHPQPSVLIVSYIESAKAAAQFGFYQKAEWKPDDSMIAVAVSTQLHLLILYLQFDWCPSGLLSCKYNMLKYNHNLRAYFKNSILTTGKLTANFCNIEWVWLCCSLQMKYSHLDPEIIFSHFTHQ